MATVSQRELRHSIGDVLRRAEAGETITITVSGRPVAQVGPIGREHWVPSELLAPIWRTMKPRGHGTDLAGCDVELDDPFTR